MESLLHDRVILIAEDEAEVREFLGTVIEMMHPTMTVLLAENGQRALEIISEQRPDVVLLDLKMPVLNGFKVLQILKNREDTRHIPILVLTGLGDEEVLVDILDTGADGFMKKPVSRKELSAHVLAMLRIKARYDELESRALSQEARFARLVDILDTELGEERSRALIARCE